MLIRLCVFYVVGIWSQAQVDAVRSTPVLDSEMAFTFNRKLMFTANQNLNTIRSRNHTLLFPPAAVRHPDLWDIKPPDFSPKLYCTLNLPRIKTKTLNPAVLKEGLSPRIDIIPPSEEQKSHAPAFLTSYKPPGLLELQLRFVKSGQFPRGPYNNPKPHNFRPVSFQHSYRQTLCLLYMILWPLSIPVNAHSHSYQIHQSCGSIFTYMQIQNRSSFLVSIQTQP